MGYNTSTPAVGDEGFYWAGHLDVTMAAELDNGVTASVTFDSDIADAPNLGEAFAATDFVLTLKTEGAALVFGDTKFAAQSKWKSAGVMVADNFSEADGETVLRGDVSMAGVDASVSYILDSKTGAGAQVNDLNQLSIGASAALGAVTVVAAYQAASDEAAGFYASDVVDAEVYGVSASTAVAGATVTAAYADNGTTNSIGVSASYPVGAVTLSGFYVVEDAGDNSFGVKAVYKDGPVNLTANYEDRQGVNRYNVEGSYDLGNGLVAKAGYLDRENWTGEAIYAAGEYALGGGASLLVSYADAEDAAYAADNEIGAPEYQLGTTVAVSFKF